MNISNVLRTYLTENPEEERKVSSFFNLCESTAFLRDDNDEAHLTASVLIMNPGFDKVLLLYHDKLQKWLQPGGHVEQGESVIDAAKRECLEEVGAMVNLSEEDLLDIDIHLIPPYGTLRAHHHYDVRFLAVLHESIPVREGLRWIEVHELLNYTDEASIHRMVEKAQKRAKTCRESLLSCYNKE